MFVMFFMPDGLSSESPAMNFPHMMEQHSAVHPVGSAMSQILGAPTRDNDQFTFPEVQRPRGRGMRRLQRIETMFEQILERLNHRHVDPGPIATHPVDPGPITTHPVEPEPTTPAIMPGFLEGADASNVGNYTVRGIDDKKEEILDAVDTVLENNPNVIDLEALSPNDVETLKAVILAIASSETEGMDASEYPVGDNKSGDAYNFSLFKLNIGELRKVDPNVPDNERLAEDYAAARNHDIQYAVEVILKLINLYQAEPGVDGIRRFLEFHRGGASWNNPDIINPDDLHAYLDGVRNIASVYYNNEDAQTNDQRYYLDIKAI